MQTHISLRLITIALLCSLSAPAFAQSGNSVSGSSASNTGSNSTRSINTDSRGGGSMNSSVNAGVSDTSNMADRNSPNWDSEIDYWRGRYPSVSYYNKDRDYSTYEPAYRYGMELYRQNLGKSYNELDTSRLSNGWSQARGSSNLNWNDAQLATRDAYMRMMETQRSGTSGTSNVPAR